MHTDIKLTKMDKNGLLFESNKEQEVAKKLAIAIEDLSQIEQMGRVAEGLSKNFKKLGEAETKIKKAAEENKYQKALKKVEDGTGDVLDVGLDIISHKGNIIQYLNVFLEFGPTLKDALEILLDDVNELVKNLQNEEVQEAIAKAVSKNTVTLEDIDKKETFSNRDEVRYVIKRMNRVQHNLKHLNHALNALAVFGKSLRSMQMNKNIQN